MSFDAARGLLLAAGCFLVWGMILGVWKYVQMARPPFASHPYVDIAHRSALMYAGACVVLCLLTRQSTLPDAVEWVAAALSVALYAAAVCSYVINGLCRRSGHQFDARAPKVLHLGMLVLIASEIGAASVLLYGATVSMR